MNPSIQPGLLFPLEFGIYNFFRDRSFVIGFCKSIFAIWFKSIDFLISVGLEGVCPFRSDIHNPLPLPVGSPLTRVNCSGITTTTTTTTTKTFPVATVIISGTTLPPLRLPRPRRSSCWAAAVVAAALPRHRAAPTVWRRAKNENGARRSRRTPWNCWTVTLSATRTRQVRRKAHGFV